MAYAPLDEKFDDHPKYIEYGVAEMGLIACGITYCNRNLTDGVIPRSWPTRRFGPEIEPVVQRLLRDGVWRRRDDGSFEIVGFLDHNRSKEEILAIKAKRAAAGGLGGRKSAKARADGQASASADATAPGQADAKAHGQAGAQVPAEPTPLHLHVTPLHATTDPQPKPTDTPPTGGAGGSNGHRHEPMQVLPLSEVRLNGPAWIETYQAAASKALGGRKWVFNKKQLHDLNDLIGVHCVDKSRIDLWIAAIVAAFIEAVKDEKPGHYMAYQPAGLAKWLNEGGGSKSKSNGASEVKPDIIHIGRRYKFIDGKYVDEETGAELPGGSS